MADMAIQVPINLATEPFRRDRPILVAFAGGAVLLVVLLAIQVTTILTERHQLSMAPVPRAGFTENKRN